MTNLSLIPLRLKYDLKSLPFLNKLNPLAVDGSENLTKYCDDCATFCFFGKKSDIPLGLGAGTLNKITYHMYLDVL